MGRSLLQSVEPLFWLSCPLCLYAVAFGVTKSVDLIPCPVRSLENVGPFGCGLFLPLEELASSLLQSPRSSCRWLVSRIATLPLVAPLELWAISPRPPMLPLRRLTPI